MKTLWKKYWAWIETIAPTTGLILILLLAILFSIWLIYVVTP